MTDFVRGRQCRICGVTTVDANTGEPTIDGLNTFVDDLCSRHCAEWLRTRRVKPDGTYTQPEETILWPPMKP